MLSTKKKLKERCKNVLIYQMGKVASSSVKASLSGLDNISVTHTHHLNHKYVEELNQVKRAKGWQISITPESVSKLKSKLITADPIHVISLVREPIGRNISAYFQNLDVIFNQKNAYKFLSYDTLLKGFIDRYPHSIPIDWFDKEVKEVLGIDVYKYDFPKDEGSMVITEGNIRVLLMRFDLNEEIKKRNLELFLNIHNLSQKRENIGALKPYRDAYKHFLDKASFSGTYLEHMLESRYARHFFGARELKALRSGWS